MVAVCFHHVVARSWLMLVAVSRLAACVQYEEMYRRSIEDPNGFWSDIAKQFTWSKQV